MFKMTVIHRIFTPEKSDHIHSFLQTALPVTVSPVCDSQYKIQSVCVSSLSIMCVVLHEVR